MLLNYRRILRRLCSISLDGYLEGGITTPEQLHLHFGLACVNGKYKFKYVLHPISRTFETR